MAAKPHNLTNAKQFPKFYRNINNSNYFVENYGCKGNGIYNIISYTNTIEGYCRNEYHFVRGSVALHCYKLTSFGFLN